MARATAATPARVIIIIGSNGYWAKADDAKTARKNAHNPKHYLVYSVHPDTTVDGLGDLTYPSKHKPILLEQK